MPRVTAPFTITATEPATDSPWTGAAPALGCTTMRKAYAGPLDGTAVLQMLTCIADPSDMSRGAAYTALEQISGRLEGREGTFVIQHGATMGGGAASPPTGTVVPNSGTGDLAGLAGTVEIHRGPDGSHALLLDVTFE